MARVIEQCMARTPTRELVAPVNMPTAISEHDIRDRVAKIDPAGQTRAALVAAAAKAGVHADRIVSEVERHAREGRMHDAGPVARLANDKALGSNARPIASAADKFVRMVHSARQSLTYERNEAADRAATPVPGLSQDLVDAIARGEGLTSNQRAELAGVKSALERRFGDDLGALRGGKHLQTLASRHGLDKAVLDKAREMVSQVDKGVQQSRAQAVKRDGPTR